MALVEPEMRRHPGWSHPARQALRLAGALAPSCGRVTPAKPNRDGRRRCPNRPISSPIRQRYNHSAKVVECPTQSPSAPGPPHRLRIHGPAELRTLQHLPDRWRRRHRTLGSAEGELCEIAHQGDGSGEPWASPTLSPRWYPTASGQAHQVLDEYAILGPARQPVAVHPGDGVALAPRFGIAGQGSIGDDDRKNSPVRGAGCSFELVRHLGADPACHLGVFGLHHQPAVAGAFGDHVGALVSGAADLPGRPAV